MDVSYGVVGTLSTGALLYTVYLAQKVGDTGRSFHSFLSIVYSICKQEGNITQSKGGHTH
jgi:hypothetical protein